MGASAEFPRDSQQEKDSAVQYNVDVQALSAAAKSEERVCVIGCGKSGLIGCKVLTQRGVAFDCFEEGSQIGGLWVLNNDSGRSACYDSLRINTSKLVTRFHDFPVPKHYPMFCPHQEMLAYLESYVDHFGFRKQITFRTQVVSVIPQLKGGFTVSTKALDTGKVLTRHYTSVIVACGHHWDPLWPKFKGNFTGDVSHSHGYRTPKPFVGKRVMVIGGGNSGMDIAAELALSGAAKTILSCRRPVHVVPRWVFGKPSDVAVQPWLGVTVPRRWVELCATGAFWLSRGGSQESYGLPTPKFGLFGTHPTVNPGAGDILQLIKKKKVTPKPGILCYNDNTVTFLDGTSEEVDAVVCATGYNAKVPFLPEDCPVTKDGKTELMHLVVHPKLPGVYFLGFIQAHGPMIPCVESQMSYAADLIQGVSQLPPPEKMEKTIAKQHDFNRKNFTQVERHALMVEFHRYLLQTQMARCPKDKRGLGKKLWRTKRFLQFCAGQTC